MSCPGPGRQRWPRRSRAGLPSAQPPRPRAGSSGPAATTDAARRYADPSRWLPQFTPRLLARSPHVMSGQVGFPRTGASFLLRRLPEAPDGGGCQTPRHEQPGAQFSSDSVAGRPVLSTCRSMAIAMLVVGRASGGCSAAPATTGGARTAARPRRQPGRRELCLQPGGRPRPVRKILVIMEENHSVQQAFPGGMPYLWSLAQRYAYATDWSDVAHPSLAQLPGHLRRIGVQQPATIARPRPAAATRDHLFSGRLLPWASRRRPTRNRCRSHVTPASPANTT